jgi:DNA-binding HxlR family transcriptional regulator
MHTQIFSKFVRPEKPAAGRTTDRDLEIIETILRYRFVPTSELVRLVGGNEDVTLRRLRRLWEKGLINRWAFPGIRTHSEFYYYLDNREALNLLVEHGRLFDVHEQMLEELRNNREKDYATAATRGQHMKLGFLQHSLLISRMHFMVEMACRDSGENIELQSWSQGSQLAGHKVEVPRVKSSRHGNEYLWGETGETERLPVEPDALFTLRFANRRAGSQLAHFCYEADRGTMVMTDMLKKFRAYHHFIKRQKKHRDALGVHPIRAVLVETTDEARGKKLMDLVNHPLVCGPGNRAGLFWFTISPLFADCVPVKNGANSQPLPLHLEKPSVILDQIWALPDHSLHALGDAENSNI